MSHAFVQRMFISMYRPFLRTLDFARQLYPQHIPKSHEVLVLPCTLVLLSLWVVTLKPTVNISLLVVDWGGFPCVRQQEIYSHIGICAMYWIPLSLLVVSSPLSEVFLIGCYSKGIFHVLLASGACEIHIGSLVRETSYSFELLQIIKLFLCTSC
jgi:hypothetical protein